jgi:hypothetical protein
MEHEEDKGRKGEGEVTGKLETRRTKNEERIRQTVATEV